VLLVKGPLVTRNLATAVIDQPTVTPVKGHQVVALDPVQNLVPVVFDQPTATPVKGLQLAAPTTHD